MNVVTPFENRIWKKYKLRVCGAVTYVILDVIGKSETVGEGPGAEGV